MVTIDLGACEWFVWDLRRSNLIERGKLEQIVGEYLAKRPRAEPAELAEYLVQQNLLTRFQADRLLSGKTQGFVLGPYTLVDALGTGSMGTVYKAQSKNDNNWYAVKVLPRRSMWNIRIARRKARDFEAFEHPAVVPFKDVGTSGGMHYLVWPLVEGEGLDKLVERQGKLPYAVAALYAMQTAEGMDACHQRGIIHGLLKPSNLLIAPDLQQVRILDLGIGGLLAETENESVVDTMSTANTMASGLDCASPESIEDPKKGLTALADQYSLGCTLYYCLAGQYPFPARSAVEKMMAHQTKQPTPVQELAPDVPDELVRVVERLMEKRPERRYPSMAEVATALRPFTTGAMASLRTLRRRPAAEPRPTAPVQMRQPEAPVETPAPPSRVPTPPPVPVSERTAPRQPVTLPSRESLRDAPAAEAPQEAPVGAPASAAEGQKLSLVGVALVGIMTAVVTWLVIAYWDKIAALFGLQ